MKSKITFLLTLLVLSFQSFAQMYDPVAWSIEHKQTSNTTADIVIRASLEKGWHLYGMNIPPNGPVPTKIVIEQLDNAKKEGEMQAKSKLTEVHDPNFNMKIGMYSDEAVFVQKISFTDPKAVFAKVVVSYMVCDDNTPFAHGRDLKVGKQGINLKYNTHFWNRNKIGGSAACCRIAGLCPTKWHRRINYHYSSSTNKRGKAMDTVIGELKAFGEDRPNTRWFGYLF